MAVTGERVGIVRAPSTKVSGLAGALMQKQGRTGAVYIRRALAARDGAWVSPEMCWFVHEAGHAIVGLDVGIPATYVTAIDEHGDGAGGVCEIESPEWLLEHLRGKATRGHEPTDPDRRALLRSNLVQCVAGYAAERHLLGGRRPPRNFWPATRDSDAGHAATCARLLGVRGKAIKPFVARASREATTILARRWHEVVALAMHLEVRWARRRIDATDIARIIKGAKRKAPSPLDVALGRDAHHAQQ